MKAINSMNLDTFLLKENLHKKNQIDKQNFINTVMKNRFFNNIAIMFAHMKSIEFTIQRGMDSIK